MKKRDWPNEATIRHRNGSQLRFPGYPDSISYVRVVSGADEEIAYWTIDEVAEDPAEVLVAIFGAVMREEPRTDSRLPGHGGF